MKVKYYYQVYKMKMVIIKLEEYLVKIIDKKI